MRDPEWPRRLYSKLLTLYPRPFRDRFTEQMEQNFVDFCRERRTREVYKSPVVLWLFGETIVAVVRENLSAGGNRMKNVLTNPRWAASIALVCALPLTFILPVAMFNIEPLNGFFQYLLTESNSTRQHAVGLGIILLSMLLVPVGMVVSFVPVIASVRSGKGVLSHPFNLALGIILLVFALSVWGSLIVDQIPCWMGEPNCD